MRVTSVEDNGWITSVPPKFRHREIRGKVKIHAWGAPSKVSVGQLIGSQIVPISDRKAEQAVVDRKED
jgi:ABC-type tungstate transport system permease subunit